MNILMIGCGQIGQHIAEVLSKEEHNVTVVDHNRAILEKTGNQSDVAVRCGDGTDWRLLDDCLELMPDLFLAMTDDDETNLVACSMAKNLGYPKTVARVKQERYLNHTRLDLGRIFYVDHFLGPDLLVAQDILKHVKSPGSVAIEPFAHGAIEMRTIVVPPSWKKDKVSLSELKRKWPEGMMVGLIKRSIEGEGRGAKNKHSSIIFPHGEDRILAGDEVTCIGETDVVDDFHQLFGLTIKPVKSVAIVGGTLIGLHLARLLESKGISVRIIDKDYDRCCYLAENLLHSTVIHHDASDLDFLRVERLGDVDFFVSCTARDEVNLVLGELGYQAGCEHVAAVLFDQRFRPVAEKLGIRYVVSPQKSVANRILSIARSYSMTSMASLYNGQAEVMEVKVSVDSKVVGIPVAELGPLLPKDLLLAVIQNRGRVMVVHGDRILSPGDTVIIISNPNHIQGLRKIF